jgi:hypothetical protein
VAISKGCGKGGRLIVPPFPSGRLFHRFRFSFAFSIIDLHLLPRRDRLQNLAHDLAAVWHLPTTDMRLKQRIVRILVAEIVAEVDQENQ